MELIDRQALIKQLKDENIPFNADINEIINIQPIAFDVANIVEKLEKESKKKHNKERDVLCKIANASYSAGVKYAINIVKQEINKEN